MFLVPFFYNITKKFDEFKQFLKDYFSQFLKFYREFLLTYIYFSDVLDTVFNNPDNVVQPTTGKSNAVFLSKRDQINTGTFIYLQLIKLLS